MATENAVQIDQAQTSGAKIATLQITRAGDAVEIQETVVSDPDTGHYLKPDASGALPLSSGAATETTLGALLTAADALLMAISQLDTSAVAGTVALDAATVAALASPETQPVSGPLTDTELRATAVPVSGPLTDTELRATAVPVSGPLTDTQLRATAVPVSGPLTDTQLRASAVPVSGPLTDTQLRASAVSVSVSAVSATGTLTTNGGAVELSCAGYTTVAIDVRGDRNGTMPVEGTIDGSNWVGINVIRVESLTATFTSSVSNGASYLATVVGLSGLRVRSTGSSSGATTIVLRATQGVSLLHGLLALPASTNLIGDVGLGVRTTTTNAALRQKIISAASTNATSVKSGAGRVYGFMLANTSAAWCYLKLFNRTTAPNLGVDTPTEVIPIPPGGAIEFVNPIGVAHSLGIALAITAAPADLDATAISANDVIGTLLYA